MALATTDWAENQAAQKGQPRAAKAFNEITDTLTELKRFIAEVENASKADRLGMLYGASSKRLKNMSELRKKYSSQKDQDEKDQDNQ